MTSTTITKSTSPFATIRFTDKLEDPSIEPATVIEETDTTIVSRRGAETFPSFKENFGITWVGFSSSEEHAEFYAKHCRRKEAKAAAAISTAAEKAIVDKLATAIIFEEVAKRNAEQLSIWHSHVKPGDYSIFQLTVVDDESQPVNKWDHFFCYSLTLVVRTPYEALSYVKESLSKESTTWKESRGNLSYYSDTHHLWSDPRYILIEYVGSSIKKELSCLSMRTYTSNG